MVKEIENSKEYMTHEELGQFKQILMMVLVEQKEQAKSLSELQRKYQ
jgi:hypothetical protein